VRSTSRRSGLVPGALAALVLAGATSTTAAPITGVRGVVMRGPIHPVCRPEQPCTAPAKRIVLRFVGRYATGSTKTDLQGRYVVALAPGAYSVRIPSARFGYRPRAVTVRANRTSVLDITIDTGIR
jgi:hypothetical protein